jgi:hypothetical protein
MTIPSSTCSCFERKLSNLSNTINLTLLSASLTINSANAAAAATRQLSLERDSLNSPLTAAGFCVRVVKLRAASYLTAWEGAFNSSKMTRIHLA